LSETASNEFIQISCVIPAYERLDHFSRCLVSVLNQSITGLEILVCDDSRSDVIRRFLETIDSRGHVIRYFAGPRNGNPVDNWNFGIQIARGRYVNVLHQDEFLVDTEFYSKAVRQLDQTGAAAVIAKSAVVAISRSSRFGLAQRLSRLTGSRPWTLFLMNWIGPTATIIFRARPDLVFDSRLVNLVDVDFYFRLFGNHAGVKRIDRLAAVGLGHHEAQISAGIDRNMLSWQEFDTIIQYRQGLGGLQRRFIRCLLWMRMKLRRTGATNG
jgi:glycosyltransferase involved in cell wall biosynthesis